MKHSDNTKFTKEDAAKWLSELILETLSIHQNNYDFPLNEPI